MLSPGIFSIAHLIKKDQNEKGQVSFEILLIYDTKYEKPKISIAAN
jgi:hypothetical protein